MRLLRVLNFSEACARAPAPAWAPCRWRRADGASLAFPIRDLLESLRGRVASWWIPDAVMRVPSMPLAATGKIDKIALRAAFSGS